jgi:hypothetical protein
MIQFGIQPRPPSNEKACSQRPRPLARGHCSEWRKFEATSEARAILAAIGNIDHFRAEDYEGFSLRLFDPDEDVWRMAWSSTERAGRLDPPVEGRFDADGHARRKSRRPPSELDLAQVALEVAADVAAPQHALEPGAPLEVDHLELPHARHPGSSAPPTLAELEPAGRNTIPRMRADSLDWVAGMLAGAFCDFEIRRPDELRVSVRTLADRLRAA